MTIYANLHTWIKIDNFYLEKKNIRGWRTSVFIRLIGHTSNCVVNLLNAKKYLTIKIFRPNSTSGFYVHNNTYTIIFSVKDQFFVFIKRSRGKRYQVLFECTYKTFIIITHASMTFKSETDLELTTRNPHGLHMPTSS